MTSNRATRPSVLILHGLFGRPVLLSPWIEFLSAAGFTCHTPTLPWRDPVDRDLQREVGLDNYLRATVEAYDELDEPPVVIGHSIGGLLGQRLTTVRHCRALILLASVPPGMLWTRPIAMPHLIRLLPAILAGRDISPSAETFREIPLHGLPRDEQDDLIPRMVPDSGRVFRAMMFDTAATRVKREAVSCPVLCVSGGADRNVASWISRRIARRYKAEHHVHSSLPHWIVAAPALDDVAPPVLAWLTKTLGNSVSDIRRPTDEAAAKQPSDMHGCPRSSAGSVQAPRPKE